MKLRTYLDENISHTIAKYITEKKKLDPKWKKVKITTSYGDDYTENPEDYDEEDRDWTGTLYYFIQVNDLTDDEIKELVRLKRNKTMTLYATRSSDYDLYITRLK